MKVSIISGHEYLGRSKPLVESFELTVEGGFPDSPEHVADTYLMLRKKLKEGIKGKVGGK